MEITERQMQMLSPQGFDKLFEQEMPDHDTYRKAYQALEEEYQAAFGRRRYASYTSFRLSRRKRLKV